MIGGSWHSTGDRDQDHPHGKEMQKRKLAIWGGLTNSCEKKSTCLLLLHPDYTPIWLLCTNAVMQVQRKQISPRILRQGKDKGMTSLHWLKHSWKEAIEERDFEKWNPWKTIDPRRCPKHEWKLSTTELALHIVGESVDHSVVGVRKITGSLPHTTHSNQLSMQRKASKLIAENIGEYQSDLNVGKNSLNKNKKCKSWRKVLSNSVPLKLKNSIYQKGQTECERKLQSGKRNMQNI